MKLGEAIPNYQAYRNELQDKKTSIYKQYKKQRKRLSVPMMKNGYKRQQSLSFHIRKQLMI